LPAGLGTKSFARSVADFASDRPHRRRLQMNVDIDRLAIGRGREADIGRRDETSGDESATEIVHFRALEWIAGIEPRKGRDVTSAEWRPPANADPPEMCERTGGDGENQAGGMGLMVYLDLLLTDFGQGKALFAERDLERRPLMHDIVGDHGISGLDG